MAEKIFPTMKMEELFAVEVVHSALRTDSSPTTHPMTPPAHADDKELMLQSYDNVAFDKCMFIFT